jgi:hypothetical protein
MKFPVSKSKSAADSVAERVGWAAAAVPLWPRVARAAADALPSPPSSSDLRRGENSETGERLNVVMDCVLFVISARSGGILFDTRLVNSFLKRD